VSPIALHRLLPVLALATLSCGGASTPPPPVAAASPTPGGTGGLRPLSSRETVPAGPQATGGTTPAGLQGPEATLPPGHPPIGEADPHGNVPGGTARSAGSIVGTITLSPRLQANPTDVLYVMAKKGAATLAVRRIDKPTFPFAFEISGGDSMMAGVAFEGPVDVVARLSRTGDAIPAKGDLEGVARGVGIPATNVKLAIDSVRQ
jgi:hypothetical protein